MRRFLSAISVFLAAALVFAPAVSSAKPKKNKVKTFEAIGVVDSFSGVDNDPAGDSLGDSLVFTQKLYKDETKTKQIGTDEAFCVRTVPGVRRLCTGIFYLRGGTITIAGPESAGVHSLAITGGTGKWFGARGEVVLNSIDPVTDEMEFRVIR